MPDLYFFEQMGQTGRWCPVVQPGPVPITQAGGVLRLKRSDGIGPRLRREPQKISRGHEALTLDQLAESYGVDGRFTNA